MTKERKRFRTHCPICGRITWHPKACENNHDNMMERYYERKQSQEDDYHYQQYADSLRDHPKYCDCYGCVHF